MIRLSILLSTILLLTSCSRNTPESEVIDSGLYDAVILTSGIWLFERPVEIASVHNLEHQEEITRIPAEDGRYWGFRARLNNSNMDKPVLCRNVIEHPEFTTPLGDTSTEEVEEFELPPGHSDIHPFIWYFIEGCEHEFVPGKWTRRVFIDNREVIRREFEIFRPK